MAQREQRIALLFPSGRLELTATVKHVAILLARAGYVVDVFVARNRQCPEPVLSEPGVTLHVMPDEQPHFQEPVGRLTAKFTAWVLPRLLGKGYHAYVAAGIRGLFAATFLSLFTRVPVVCHSLELYPSWERKSVGWKIYKAVERWANRRAAFSIIQDAARADVLARDNGVALQSIVLFPVSAFGPASPAPNHRMRERLGIAPDHKIAICAGTLVADYVPAKELVRAAQQWPRGWTLVLHTNSAPEQLPVIDDLRRSDVGKRVVFSLEPVPYDELELWLASADIGLAVYRRTDDNMYYVGLSSGKMAEYLRAGLPIVVSDWPGLREFVTETGCGACVSDTDGIAAALRQIESDYAGYRARALDAFNQRLAVGNHAAALQQAFARMLGGSR